MKTFSEAVKKNSLALTAELTIRREFTANDVLLQARKLSKFADGIQVTDSPYGWTQMSAVAAASILLHHDIDAIPLLTGRDRNRIALKSDLLGLRALGMSSIILTRGKKVPNTHEVQGKTMTDISGPDLVSMAEEIRRSTDYGPKRDFLIGTQARVFRPKDDWKAPSLKLRAEAGAQFMQTQLCFNTSLLRSYMDALVELKITWDYSVIVSLTPLPSVKTARWIRKELTDSRIPKPVMERLGGADDPKQEGVDMCVELMQEIAEIPGISGINLMTTGDPEIILETLKAYKLVVSSNDEDT